VPYASYVSYETASKKRVDERRVEASYLAQGETELREQVTKHYVSENWDKVEAFGTT
jgi:hypothetical protein